MSEEARGLVTQTVDMALRTVRVDDPEHWPVLCPPPCEMPHSLTDVLPEHEAGPVFLMQVRTEKALRPRIGFIACGRSELIAGNEHRPLVDRLSPALGAMTFKVIVTPDFDQTFNDILSDLPPSGGRVDLPLVNDGHLLRVNTELARPDDVDLAILYLL